MSDLNMNEIIEGGIKAARETIKTCRLIQTRMIDQYVLAMGDGSVLHSDGIRAFGISLAKVERTGDRKKIEAFLAAIKRDNPDNGAVAQLKIMSWKDAATLQIAVAEDVIERFEELKRAPQPE
jgi:hypothetical protein